MRRTFLKEIMWNLWHSMLYWMSVSALAFAPNHSRWKQNEGVNQSSTMYDKSRGNVEARQNEFNSLLAVIIIMGYYIFFFFFCNSSNEYSWTFLPFSNDTEVSLKLKIGYLYKKRKIINIILWSTRSKV